MYNPNELFRFAAVRNRTKPVEEQDDHTRPQDRGGCFPRIWRWLLAAGKKRSSLTRYEQHALYRKPCIIELGSEGETTSVFSDVDVPQNEEEKATIRERADSFLEQHGYTYAHIEPPFLDILDRFHYMQSAETEDILREIDDLLLLLNKSPDIEAKYTDSLLLSLVSDLLLSMSILRVQDGNRIDVLAKLCKFLYIGIHHDKFTVESHSLETILHRIVLTLPVFVKPFLVPDSSPEEKRGEMHADEEGEPDIDALENELSELDRTLNDLIQVRNKSLGRIEVTVNANEREEPKKPTTTEASISHLPRELGTAVAKYVDMDSIVDMDDLERCLGNRLRDTMRRIIPYRHQKSRVYSLGGSIVKISSKPGMKTSGYTPSSVTVKKHYRGVADLMIVKESLECYELADFAYIENVFAGEHKERTHRRLHRFQEEITDTVETEEEIERDTQITTRNELESEASETAEQSAKVEGSLSVSGKYGPFVDFTSEAAAGYTSSSSHASQRSIAYSQEVIERTAKKIRTKIIKERRIKILNEVEEINVHGIKNDFPGAEHNRGIYRWLNKISTVQLFNYGVRHMFAFTFVNPAAFYLDPLTDAELVEPERPGFTASDLNRYNYQEYTALYGAVGVSPPPPRVKTVSKPFHTTDQTQLFEDTTDANKKIVHHVDTDTICIPDGYRACDVNVNIEYMQAFDDANVWFSIGKNKMCTRDADITIPFSDEFDNEMSVAVNFYCVWVAYATFDVKCTLLHNSELYRKWQDSTFEAIMDGYNRQLSIYEEKLSELQTLSELSKHQRNPDENKEIIINELKRGCISSFFHWDLSQRADSFPDDTTTYEYWHESGIWEHGVATEYMERAFEWENLAYIFHPYYHSNKENWGDKIHLQGISDSEFADFLKAGAVTVLVPARPEFAERLIYFDEYRVVSDHVEPLFVADYWVNALIEEVRAKGVDSIHDPGEASDSWKVRIPTSLVLLQDPQEIQFRDVLEHDSDYRKNVRFDPIDVRRY